jgi:hypothetical protein
MFVRMNTDRNLAMKGRKNERKFRCENEMVMSSNVAENKAVRYIKKRLVM